MKTFCSHCGYRLGEQEQKNITTTYINNTLEVTATYNKRCPGCGTRQKSRHDKVLHTIKVIENGDIRYTNGEVIFEV